MHLPAILVFLHLSVLTNIMAHPSIHRHQHKDRIHGHHQSHVHTLPSMQVRQQITNSRIQQPFKKHEQPDVFVNLSFSSATEYPEEAAMNTNVVVPLHQQIKLDNPTLGYSDFPRLTKKQGILRVSHVVCIPFVWMVLIVMNSPEPLQLCTKGCRTLNATHTQYFPRKKPDPTPATNGQQIL